RLQNKSGKFVEPNESSIRAALSSTAWARPSYYEVVTDRAGDGSWPIVGVSFALIHRNQASLADAREALDFMEWIYRHGAAAALDHHYVPIDDKVLIRR